MLSQENSLCMTYSEAQASSLPAGAPCSNQIYGHSASQPECSASEQAKLASVLLSFSQEEPRRVEESPAEEMRTTEEEASALSLARLSPAPTSIRAYAKLQGKHWEYYIQKLSITLGRSPENDSDLAAGVDVFLGSSEGISRKHLRIEYNACELQWEMYCFGRSGVIVDGERFEPFCHPVVLNSRSLVTVDDCQFHFLLPLDTSSSTTATLARLSSPIEDGRPSSQDKKQQQQHQQHQHQHHHSRKSRKVSADPVLTSSREERGECVPEESLPSGSMIKPSLSYACLIAEAINSTEAKRLTLSGIYKYLSDKYPYFRYTKSGWQNSIRHNLSLNKAFRKVPRNLGEPGKGMFWVIDANHKHLVETSGAGRRMQRSKSLQPGQTSAPSSPQIRQPGSMVSPGNYVPILPTRPLSATPIVLPYPPAQPTLLAPQLLEAATAALDPPALRDLPSQATYHHAFFKNM